LISCINLNIHLKKFQAEKYRRSIASLRSVCPALFMLFAFTSQYLDEIVTAFKNGSTEAMADQDAENSALYSLHLNLADSTSRCLGMYFCYFGFSSSNKCLFCVYL
jgi:hypothetical protein